MPAPLGNNNAGEGKRWRKALERALAHAHGTVDDGLLAIAKKRVELAEEGNADACREIGDRFDGKPTQAISGPDGGPVEARITLNLVSAARPASVDTGSLRVSVGHEG